MATVAAPIAARRRRPVLLASLQARVARPTTAIVLMAPPMKPPSGASVSTEDGAVNRTWTWSAVRASRVARRSRVSRIAAFISAVDGDVLSAASFLPTCPSGAFSHSIVSRRLSRVSFMPSSACAIAPTKWRAEIAPAPVSITPTSVDAAHAGSAEGDQNQHQRTDEDGRACDRDEHAREQPRRRPRELRRERPRPPAGQASASARPEAGRPWRCRSEGL